MDKKIETIILSDLLNSEKNISNNYSIAINEASNDTLFDETFLIFKELKNNSRLIYNHMKELGLYNVENSKLEDKEKAIEKIKNPK